MCLVCSLSVNPEPVLWCDPISGAVPCVDLWCRQLLYSYAWILGNRSSTATVPRKHRKEIVSTTLSTLSQANGFDGNLTWMIKDNHCSKPSVIQMT